jgi:hypothetical protein
MIRLIPDTADQFMYLSLKEANKYLPTFTNYLIEFRSLQSNNTYYLIAELGVATDRYSRVDLGLNTDDAVNGSIQITASGQYKYTIYGQNSTTNLNPTDISVIGIVEIGKMVLVTQENYFDSYNPTIPPNTIYYT